MRAGSLLGHALLASAIVGCGSSDDSALFAGGEAGSGSGASGGSAGPGGSAGTGGGTGGASGSGATGGSGGAGSGGKAGAGGEAGGGGGPSGSCDFAGTWGSYIDIPVEWPGTLVIRPGSGRIQVWLLHQRTHSGSSIQDLVQICGIQIPSFETSLVGGGEKYGVRFLAETFDLGFPAFPATGQVTPPDPGGTLSTEPLAMVFGVFLQDPLADPWPDLGSMATRDDDQDGQVGVTTPTEKGPGFFDPPVDALKVQRAKEMFVASRSIAVLSGSVPDCDHASGVVAIQSLAGDPAVDSHIVGCRLQSGALCDAQQTSFADGNSPNFHPQGDGAFSMLRLAAGANCSAVRFSLP
jgi:hypothetical protein